MIPCVDCNSTKRAFTIKLIPTNRPDLPHYPKFVPMIREDCVDCGRFIKWATQTPELIQKINQKLEGIKCG